MGRQRLPGPSAPGPHCLYPVISSLNVYILVFCNLGGYFYFLIFFLGFFFF